MQGPPARAKLWREPLVHFVLAGAVLFGLQRAVTHARPSRARTTDARDARRIVVSDGYLAGLRAQHRLRTGRDPSPDEERALLADYVREEALYREARAARLDEGDAIVRRRLVQKMEFFVAAEVTVDEPDDATLAAWLAAHGDALREAPRVAFEQVFFARDRRGARALDDARSARPAVIAARTPGERAALGDPFLPGNVFAPLSAREVTAAFGLAFTTALENTPEGDWQGPLESTYGAHLVRVTGRMPGRVPPLAEVREAVRARWMDAERTARADAALARIVARYEVARVREER